VSVGSANMISADNNATRDCVAIALAAVRTATDEHRRLGYRDRYSRCSKQAFDQAGMLSEIAKWDTNCATPTRLKPSPDGHWPWPWPNVSNARPATLG
jgi:hypothetical protein